MLALAADQIYTKQAPKKNKTNNGFVKKDAEPLVSVSEDAKGVPIPSFCLTGFACRSEGNVL